MKYKSLSESARLLNDYLTDGTIHSVAEIIIKAREINPNIPAHIIGASKPNSIKVELYCRNEDRSVIVPFESSKNEYIQIPSNIKKASLWKRLMRWIRQIFVAKK